MITRREMLKQSLAVSGAALLVPRLFAAGNVKAKAGVQLYSVRGICKNDKVPEIFKALKEMGYAGVEFAGYYGKSAADLRQLLDDTGLQCCGTHIGAGTIQPENIGKTIEFNQTIGNKYLVVPGGLNGGEDEWKKHAETFSKAAETAKKAGMYVGYHNHQHEFKNKFPSGKCAWDVFFSNASPDVFMQMDIGHCVAAGEDPVSWVKKFPQRLRTVHAKEVYGKGYSGVLGEYPEGGSHVDWDTVFPVLENDGLEWYIVESEAHADRLDDVKGCVEFLKKKGRA
ncbi:MAG: sugar phosphate isomerase/epimerase [Planctomycetaceae bacterium]|jgi:sugar phosphate isomerase/epimerase|nr:sugar phosphate isomerase/epimerase [Planctomycetaceae bacterium]